MPTVLITGASRGIGRALADQYESDGWTVIRTCRSPERTEEMALDLSDPRQVQEVAEKLSGTPIDVLINNAGVIGQRDGHWQYRLTTNGKRRFALTRWRQCVWRKRWLKMSPLPRRR